MIDYERAVLLVQDELARLDAVEGDAWVVYLEHTIERPFGWMFFWGSDLYAETRDPAYLVGGNSPFIVDRHTGAVVGTGTALPPEHYIQQYESRGVDPNSVEVVGWRVGANKVAAVQALREHSSLGLADAKHAVDSVLDGRPIRINTNDAKSALDLATALEAINFTVGSPQRDA
jgi:ribosomal protein L7/L12